ncbi:hypothetical protein HK097_006550, partial [Rhizophlyctis rosea]
MSKYGNKQNTPRQDEAQIKVGPSRPCPCGAIVLVDEFDDHAEVCSKRRYFCPCDRLLQPRDDDFKIFLLDLSSEIHQSRTQRMRADIPLSLKELAARVVKYDRRPTVTFTISNLPTALQIYLHHNCFTFRTPQQMRAHMQTQCE